MLLKDREESPEAPSADGTVPSAPDGACTQCGSALGRGQDWCLECGASAPGRIGAHPAGWRAAFTLIAATLLLVAGAVVASYAALSGDAEREANGPSKGPGTPIVAGAPTPAAPPAAPAQPTGPGTDPSQVVPPAGQVPKGNTIKPPTATPTPAPNATPAPAAPPTGQSEPSSPSTPPAAPVTDLKVAKGDAKTYDPYSRPAAEFGTASKAFDGKRNTVWDVTVPADGDPLRVGLTMDLGGAYTLSSIKLDTPTPGFNVEIYGSTSEKVPPDILDKRWAHLTDGKGVIDGQTISLKGKSDKKLRRVVLWFTMAGDAQDPRVAIGEASVRGSK